MGNILFEAGDIIKCFRGLYWHFGEYLGNGSVIHFSTHDSGDLDILKTERCYDQSIKNYSTVKRIKDLSKQK